ncbi:MAG: glycosyl transferase, family 9 [Frankiales bacterium]|nr:glycosyl transferase, family 9 [Frankiales bacterium]
MVRDVLMLRALGLGDLLTAVPAMRAVRRHYRADLVTLLTSPDLIPLAELAQVADAVLPVEPFVLGPLPPLACDVAVNLHGRGPESTRSLLERAPGTLVAFRHPAIPETAGAPPWDPGEHEVTRWCRLLDSNGIPAYPGDLVLDTPAEAPPGARATIVHPGAAAGSRRWPAGSFAEVARRLAADGHDVVVTGGPDERALAAEVCAAAGMPASANLAGTTDVMQLAALMSAARLVVTGDTGVAHLATAYERPSVVLFGPTSPALWGPPARPWHRYLWNGSTGNPHAVAPDPGLLGISVDEVLAAAAAVDRGRRELSRVPRDTPTSTVVSNGRSLASDNWGV